MQGYWRRLYIYIYILEYRSLRSQILALRQRCGMYSRMARMSDATVLLTKKNQKGLIKFKIPKPLKHILNFLFIKFYDSGNFILAVIVKTPIGTWSNVSNLHLVHSSPFFLILFLYSSSFHQDVMFVDFFSLPSNKFSCDWVYLFDDSQAMSQK